MFCRVLLTGVLAVAIAGDLHGQTTAPVSPGDRVRITTMDGKVSRAFTVSRIDSSSIVVTPKAGGPARVIALSDVKRLDRSVSRRSRGEAALRGAAGGFAVGAIAGAALGAMSGGNCGSDYFCGSRSEAAVFLGGTLGAVGASVGAFFSALSPGEKWQRVEWASSVSITPLSGGGIGVGYSRGF
jgi:hypothetical protein